MGETSLEQELFKGLPLPDFIHSGREAASPAVPAASISKARPILPPSGGNLYRRSLTQISYVVSGPRSIRTKLYRVCLNRFVQGAIAAQCLLFVVAEPMWSKLAASAQLTAAGNGAPSGRLCLSATSRETHSLRALSLTFMTLPVCFEGSIAGHGSSRARWGVQQLRGIRGAA